MASAYGGYVEGFRTAEDERRTEIVSLQLTDLATDLVEGRGQEDRRRVHILGHIQRAFPRYVLPCHC